MLTWLKHSLKKYLEKLRKKMLIFNLLNKSLKLTSYLKHFRPFWGHQIFEGWHWFYTCILSVSFLLKTKIDNHILRIFWKKICMLSVVPFFNGVSFLFCCFLISGVTNELKPFSLKDKKVRVIYSKQDKALIMLVKR